jgi:hypothetical protein
MVFHISRCQLFHLNVSKTESDLIGNWIAFDLEWVPQRQSEEKQQKDTRNSPHSYPTEINCYTKIVTFAYEDIFGNRKVLDISTFQNYSSPEYEFLTSIQNKLLVYRYCFAWGSKSIRRKNKQNNILGGVNGDLAVLDANLKHNGIPSLVKYDKFTGKPFISNYGATTDIDLFSVFAKPFIRHVIFKNKYKNLNLQEVATSLLGFGKLGDKSGSAILKMTVDQRKSYCMHDAHLVAELLRVNNGDVLKIMKVIANHADLKLEEICEKGMTAIWTRIMNDAISRRVDLVGYDKLPFILRRLYSETHYYSYSDYRDIEDIEVDGEKEVYDGVEYYLNDKEDEQTENWNSESRLFLKGKESVKESCKEYKGAMVLEPTKGIHFDVHVFDVTSLYPTIIIKYNLSPETVNCACCRNNPMAGKEVSDEITDGCLYQSREGRYWICQRSRGLFSKILGNLTRARIEYKNNGSEIESQAVKAIINSGYGVFGHPHFKYCDPRVAELVTAFGRQILGRMQSIAKKSGFTVLYGDTDSLFVSSVGCIANIYRFISESKLNLGISVEHERTFAKLLLTGKKHYIRIFSDDHRELVIKGMEGTKSDRPEFIHKVFKQLVYDIKYDRNPVPNLRRAISDLNNKNVPAQELAISISLRKNPEEYNHVSKQAILGGKQGLRKGMPLEYYKSYHEESVYEPSTGKYNKRIRLESDDPYDISYAKYKEMLLNSVKDVIEILGYDIEDLLDVGKKRIKDSVYFSKQ